MYGFIYLTTNKVNGKKYIGMCKNTHREGYIGSGKLLKESVKKYGKQNFERLILQECETFEELSSAEQHWIIKYNAVEDPTFYNLTSGGFGGNSDYLKEYWSKLNKQERKTCRSWSRRNQSGSNNSMYGKKHTEETKQKIGLRSVNRNWHKPNHEGSNNPRAKKVLVEMCGMKKQYECLKEFYNVTNIAPYGTLKYIAKNGTFSKKYNLKITYV